MSFKEIKDNGKIKLLLKQKESNINYTIMKLKNYTIATINFLIDFFATVYDLVNDFIKLLIDFFAYQYDLASDFIIFLCEYLKWITDFHSTKSANFTRPAEEPIKINNQNHYDLR